MNRAAKDVLSSTGSDCGCPEGQCGTQFPRRDLLKLGGVIAAGALASSSRLVMAGPFTVDDFAQLVPPDKKLSKEWMETLFARGEPMQAVGEDLRYIGMPINGICTGQVYLGGDGKLWYWNLDNTRDPSANSRGTRYLEPSLKSSPFEQGFAIKVTIDGREQVLTLDADGFDDITFTNRYPMAEVAYRKAGSPVSVDLEAMTPFIPLDRDESSYPVTILRYTLTNLTDQPQQVGIAGWIENMSNRRTGSSKLGQRVNRFTAGPDVSVVECSVEPPFPITDGEEETEVFADFEGQDYGDWTVEGDAFGQAPAKGARGVQKLASFEGQGLVNSWTGSDEPQGKLTSPEFVIRRPFINFLIGGGRYRNATAIELLVDGQQVRVATGENSDTMRWVTWHVADLQGKTGQIVIKDSASGGWGHIDVDHIEFSTVPRQSDLLLHRETDFGALAIAVLAEEAPELIDLDLRPGAEWAFGQRPADLANGRESRRKLDEKMFASLGRQITLAPQEQETVVFALGWRFPNATPTNGNFYATRWSTATGMLQAVAGTQDSLRDTTKLWVETWNDSTLPHWFLERTFVTVGCVQTLTAQRFTHPHGRYNFNEGVQCCGGNCTHVWHYAQGLARIFPEIERECRRQVEFGIGFQKSTGQISYRATASGFAQAIDGQCGTILRVLRESQMSSDYKFLESLWPLAKKAMEYTIRTWDPDEDGLSGGKQHNTLDADWYGEVPWLVNLYHAALKASATMARRMNDELFANKCERILESGLPKMIAQLWNEDYGYFVMRRDPQHTNTIGSLNGCHIDQVLGDSWLWNVGLERVLPRDKILSALQSLWKYNFTPDVGPFRHELPAGRWYAAAGDAGLIMCTFPFGGREQLERVAGPVGYFNECMTGFEWQVAAHMIWEGMLTEGFSVAKAIHDRYSPALRNPYNEIECSDHYARAMASFGAYLAACGYRYDGPRGYLGFAPRLTPENFRAAFIAAEGWGTFAQTIQDNQHTARISVRWGRVRLNTISLGIGTEQPPRSVRVTIGNLPVDATIRVESDQAFIRFAKDKVLNVGDELTVELI